MECEHEWQMLFSWTGRGEAGGGGGTNAGNIDTSKLSWKPAAPEHEGHMGSCCIAALATATAAQFASFL